VVSTRTGHLYERRLVEKAIAETGECPVTRQPLSREELLPVKTNKVSAPPPRVGHTWWPRDSGLVDQPYPRGAVV